MSCTCTCNKLFIKKLKQLFRICPVKKDIIIFQASFFYEVVVPLPVSVLLMQALTPMQLAVGGRC